jgi:hypothetical protein
MDSNSFLVLAPLRRVPASSVDQARALESVEYGPNLALWGYASFFSFRLQFVVGGEKCSASFLS